MADQKNIWVDEDGQNVEIRSFFSKIFVDDEMTALNIAFDWHGYKPEQVASSLGKAEKEFIAMRILSLCIISKGFCGVLKDELIIFLATTGEEFYLKEMIEQGYLRKKKVMGKEVLFPTRNLLVSQNVREIRSGRLITAPRRLIMK